ncbi:lysylphosphatidylglycerol synthase transmembrane domain-containing protein, partial [Sulfurirhabdus autotrophica]
SLAAFFSEHFSNLISMLILVSIGLWVYPQAQPLVVALAIAILIGLGLLQQTTLLKFLKSVAKNRLPVRPGKLVSSTIDIVLHSGRCFRLPMLILGIVFGLIAWGSEGVAFYYILSLLENNISLQTALFIYAFSMLIGALSFLPGGLGGAEATMLALLMLNHVEQPQAVAATLIIRLATLWFAVILGIIALAMPVREQAK